jgi:hypothetical protein
MKLKRLVTTVLFVVLSSLLAHAQDLDTALSKLTDDLAAKIKAGGCKKVTVLDFTDLQGGSSELGRYIAEQLNVDLVMTKHDFAVLDRANLKSILAEHKLTATGLVDPENAKQLGKFAGVDALIIGNITPYGKHIKLAVKVITTETAEIVGAAKAEFQSDDTVQQLLAQPTEQTDVTGTQQPAEPANKPFGDLSAKVDSLRVNLGDGHYGYATMTLIITNASKSLTYGVGVDPNFYQNFNLSNKRGDIFRATEVTGIDTIFQAPGGFRGSLTEIPPRSAITITAKSQVGWMGKAGEYPPYHFQTEVVFGPEKDGRCDDLKKYNLVRDIKN